MVTKLKTVKALREQLIEMREEADRFVKQATSSDPGVWDLDLVTVGTGSTSEEKAAWFRGMMDEISSVQKDFDEAMQREGFQDTNGKALDYLKKPGTGMPQPTSGGGFDGGESDPLKGKSLGRLFTESAAFKEFRGRQGPEVTIEFVNEDTFKELIGAGWGQKTLLSETGFAPQAVRTGLVLPGVLQAPLVADLIPQGTTNQIAIVYMEETTTTNSAAAVAEGGTKPESALAFTERTATVRKIATVLPVTDELLSDEPTMRAYIEGRLRIFLAREEERELINGSGTAPEIRGMMNVVGIQTQAKGADATPDAIYKAMDLIRTGAFLDPSGVIIHPLDWQDIRLLKTADGIYIWGPPMDVGPQRIWGVPVVVTTAATQNTAIVGAFDTAMQIFRRAEVTFAVSDQHSTFFIENKLMLRVEERLAFPVYRPAGICTVTGI